MQVTAIATWQVHGLVNHGAGLDGNRSSTLITATGTRSRLPRLNNNVLQRFVVAPLLFNTYTSELPTTASRNYVDAVDLAIMLMVIA